MKFETGFKIRKVILINQYKDKIHQLVEDIIYGNLVVRNKNKNCKSNKCTSLQYFVNGPETLSNELEMLWLGICPAV